LTLPVRLLHILVLVFGLLAGGAGAHNDGESYVYLNVGEMSLSGRFEILMRDVARVAPVDTDGDGLVSEAEFDTGREAVYAALQPAIAFDVLGNPTPIEITGHRFFDAGFATFVQVEFTTGVAATMPDEVGILYRPYIASQGADVPVLVLIESNERTGLEGNEARHSLVFGPEPDQRMLDLTGGTILDLIKSFLVFGTKHILIGYDHLLFLVALLLPSVLVAGAAGWQPVPGVPQALWNVVKVVALFTIAHSITLSLAALEVVRLPERLVESLIAASIAVAAAANLIAAPRRSLWIVIVGFGLLHGMGFATVLAPYGVSSGNMVPSLLAFNLGIEIGQVIFIVACFPILYLLRHVRLYVPVVLYGGSFLLILVSLYWFTKRAFGIEFSLSNFLL